jgi:DnaJ-class molecular chaperone
MKRYQVIYSNLPVPARLVACPDCKGSGTRLWKRGKCNLCKGSGYIRTASIRVRGVRPR